MSFVTASALLLLIASGAFALVLHPASEPPANWANKPPDSIVGRWRTNASCVAIAPNYIITVRHQGGSVGSSVFFDGVEYLVKQIWNEPSTDGSADMRICRIETLSADPADLQHYAQPYTLTDEVTQPQDVAIGGYGVSRGTTLFTNNNKPYAYDWDYSFGNTVQRWGSNHVDPIPLTNFPQSPITASTSSGTHTTEYILADFDDLNQNGTTSFESIVAEHDSGGGWFIQCGNSWKVLGLSLYLLSETGHPEKTSLFRTNTAANQPDPDYFTAIRISSYAAWINSIVPQPTCVSFVAGDFSGDCMTDDTDLNLLINEWMRTDCSAVNNDCSGVDFQPDGSVDMLEYAFLASGWMTGSEPLSGCN